MSVIRKAVKRRPKLRVGWSGPSKSGKTGSMLSVMTGRNPWTGEEGPALCERIGLIDAEAQETDPETGELAGTAELYADLFEFDIIVLKKTHPQDYSAAITEFASQGYDGLIIDGLTPAWHGPLGCLKLSENLAQNKFNGNTFRAWNEVNVEHDRLFQGDAKFFGIKNYPGHVFASVHAKTKHVQEVNEKTGKTTIRKVGMGPMQRAEIDYEFDTFFEIEGNTIVVKGTTRVHTMSDKTFENPGPAMTKIFLEWLDDGTITH